MHVIDRSTVASYLMSVSVTRFVQSQTFSPSYATFSPFFARFVTLLPRCNLSLHIIDNYAILCNILCQLNYHRKNGRSRR